MTENWLPIPGYEDLYEVSDLGRVRSVPRKGVRRDCIKAQQKRSNHWRVNLYRSGEPRPTSYAVHNLILGAFVGPKPRPDSFGCHHDDNPDNNTLSNLYWGDRSTNAHDMVRNGVHNHARKTHCKHGHPLSGDNLIITKRQRACRACSRRRNAEYEARKAYALAVYVADITEIEGEQ